MFHTEAYEPLPSKKQEDHQPKVVSPVAEATAKLLNELSEDEMRLIIASRYPHLKDEAYKQPRPWLIGFLSSVGLESNNTFIAPRMPKRDNYQPPQQPQQNRLHWSHDMPPMNYYHKREVEKKMADAEGDPIRQAQILAIARTEALWRSRNL